MTIALRPFRDGDEGAAMAAQRELAADEMDFLLELVPGMTWHGFVERLAEIRQGIDLAPGRVRAALLAADVDGELVGRVSIRYELTDWLAEVGGHIGYAVRPQFRRRGHATAILRGALDLARAEGLDRVLLTCDEDNAASARTIETCGGVFERHCAQSGGVPKRRYWIALTP